MGRQWRWRTETQNKEFINTETILVCFTCKVGFLEPDFTLSQALQNSHLNFVNRLESNIKWWRVRNNVFTNYVHNIIKLKRFITTATEAHDSDVSRVSLNQYSKWLLSYCYLGPFWRSLQTKTFVCMSVSHIFNMSRPLEHLNLIILTLQKGYK
jgi:hypothetical protein